MSEREQAYGRFNLLNKDLAGLYVKFSSYKTSLNDIIGGYKVDSDFASMDLKEAEVLIKSLSEIQQTIKRVLKEITFYKDKFGFEE